VEPGAKLQNDDYHSTSWLAAGIAARCLDNEIWSSPSALAGFRGGNSPSLLMRTACQVSEIERRLPGISPRIEFLVYIPLLAGVSGIATTNTLPSPLAPVISPKGCKY